MPRLLSNPLAIPGYSDAAIDHNTWMRAWLMLEIDDSGSVRRLKQLARPGFDLDSIAIREAFKLRFKPALDRAGKPTGALVIWVFDWPPYYWMREHRNQSVARMPPDARRVPCRGTGGTHSTYRDCSLPDLSKGMSQPWVDRPQK
jgi:hypothetical protein